MVDSGTNAVIVPLDPDMRGEIAECNGPIARAQRGVHHSAVFPRWQASPKKIRCPRSSSAWPWRLPSWRRGRRLVTTTGTLWPRLSTLVAPADKADAIYPALVRGPWESGSGCQPAQNTGLVFSWDRRPTSRTPCPLIANGQSKGVIVCGQPDDHRPSLKTGLCFLWERTGASAPSSSDDRRHCATGSKVCGLVMNSKSAGLLSACQLSGDFALSLYLSMVGGDTFLNNFRHRAWSGNTGQEIPHNHYMLIASQCWKRQREQRKTKTEREMVVVGGCYYRL